MCVTKTSRYHDSWSVKQVQTSRLEIGSRNQGFKIYLCGLYRDGKKYTHKTREEGHREEVVQMTLENSLLVYSVRIFTIE